MWNSIKEAQDYVATVEGKLIYYVWLAYQEKVWQFNLGVHLKLLLDARLHANVQVERIHPGRKYVKLLTIIL